MDGINSSIVLESGLCRLEVGEDCIVRSLRIKPTGEECAVPGEEISLFSVTQERPFNNEVKLAHPNRRMTFQANRIRREGDRLIIGFEITPFEAVVRVREAARYIALTLEDFIVHPDDYPGLCMTPPPVSYLARKGVLAQVSVSGASSTTRAETILPRRPESRSSLTF